MSTQTVWKKQAVPCTAAVSGEGRQPLNVEEHAEETGSLLERMKNSPSPRRQERGMIYPENKTKAHECSLPNSNRFSSF